MCLIVSQLLKSRHQCTSLVQHAISVMLYGYCSSKEVANKIFTLFVHVAAAALLFLFVCFCLLFFFRFTCVFSH